jgi:linoleoyl-CoA desaturase
MSKVKFNNNSNTVFITDLRSRVSDYFKTRNISTYGNASMYFKSVMMITAYLIPYFILLLAGISNVWLTGALWVSMGFASAGIGLSIMHDANHGSYSKNKKVNKVLGFLLNFIGGSSSNWKLQHNYLHHSFTNIEGMDEDIDPGIVMRFSPHSERLKIHRFQHIYGWFLYGLMTLSWVTAKDYVQLKRFRDTQILEKQSKSFPFLLTELTISKIIFYGYLLVLPILLSPVSWWITVLFFVMMQFIQGFLLTIVFQPAHVMQSSEYPLPDDEGNIENNWAIHQLLTTTNFAPRSKLFSWYVGGLNFQIEHHLFPNICHVHYKKISSIVKQTAQEYGIPYHVKQTFWDAITEHYRMLKYLGTVEPIKSS